MAHLFFEKNSNYYVEETREVDQFTVEIAFAPDDTQLDLLFDTEGDGHCLLGKHRSRGRCQVDRK
jgi:hypothetical protein